MIIPAVGTIVHYYSHADKCDPPCAALITEINKNGVANLKIFFGNGGDDFKRSVHHISSGFLRDQDGKLTPGALRSGAWEHLPANCWTPDCPKQVLGDIDGLDVDGEDDEMNVATTVPKASVKAYTPRSTTPAERQAKCLEYIRGGLSYDDVCLKVRYLGLTRSEVQVLFEKEGKLPDANLMAVAGGAVN